MNILLRHFKDLKNDCFVINVPDVITHEIDSYITSENVYYQFVQEEIQLDNGHMPLDDLYSLFVEWFKRCNCSGRVITRNKFSKKMEKFVKPKVDKLGNSFYPCSLKNSCMEIDDLDM
jgi:hypothetical protein